MDVGVLFQRMENIMDDQSGPKDAAYRVLEEEYGTDIAESFYLQIAEDYMNVHRTFVQILEMNFHLSETEK